MLIGLGREIAARAAGLGCDVVELPSDRLMLSKAADERAAYKAASRSWRSSLRLQGSGDCSPCSRRPTGASGYRAHCRYCYLAGSLAGLPITRVYANLEEILAGFADYVGQGSVR